MSTPCEERGWKVGDLFEVKKGHGGSFSVGSTIRLIDDDGSPYPEFALVNGSCAHLDNKDFKTLTHLTKIETESEPADEDTADFERVAAEQDRMEEEAEADAMIAQHERKLHEGVGTQDHYMNCKIQPIDFITENGMDFLEGNVVKYVARYKRKNGLEDLQKAQQYLTWLIEREERKDAEA